MAAGLVFVISACSLISTAGAAVPPVPPVYETKPVPRDLIPIERPQVDVPAPEAEHIAIATPKPRAAAGRGASSGGSDGGHGVRGIASYYCSPSAPICHWAYPLGSMVAAACGKLRNAMGSDWRGKTVTVTGSGESVTVKLVDWCGSTDKLIDLYAAPFSQLAPLSAGVVRVTVTW